MTEQTSNRTSSRDLAATRQQGITLRSVLLGFMGVCLVGALGPYNDFVLANTLLVGGYFPPVVAICLFVLIVLVNGPLYRWRRSSALSGGELSVILALMLVGCSIPGQGLMREFIPLLVAPHHHGASDPAFWKTFTSLGLPTWLFAAQDLSERSANSPVVSWFYSRVPQGEAIPWRYWLIPLGAWGIFFIAMFATLLALADILRRQWAVNERLPFPLAQLGLTLVEQPDPGRSLNRLFHARAFWIATAIVFFIHGLAALHLYYPARVPQIPLKWNLSAVLSNPPFAYLGWLVKTGTVYFTFIGITYFIRGRVAFSLWSIFLIEQLVSVYVQSYGSTITERAWNDQHLGASFAFVLGVLWIGRHHWMIVLRQAIRGPRRGESSGECLSSRTALLIVLAGLLVMVSWLRVLGVSWNMTMLILAFLLGGHLLIARVVAETGLPFTRFYAGIPQLYAWLPTSMFGAKDLFFGGAFTLTGPIATRESLLTFATHGLSIARGASYDGSIADDQAPAGRRGGILALMAAAVLIGFAVSAASSIWCYYSYASPLSTNVPQVALNSGAAETWPRMFIDDPITQHSRGRFAPQSHNSFLHLGIGAATTALLQLATWRWVAWPFLPVGYVVTGSWYIQTAWFSIFLGWLAKSLILRFGGASLFQQSKPLFVGLIFGEALAAGFWLLVNVLLALNGYNYRPVNILPV